MAIYATKPDPRVEPFESWEEFCDYIKTNTNVYMLDVRGEGWVRTEVTNWHMMDAKRRVNAGKFNRYTAPEATKKEGWVVLVQYPTYIGTRERIYTSEAAAGEAARMGDIVVPVTYWETED